MNCKLIPERGFNKTKICFHSAKDLRRKPVQLDKKFTGIVNTLGNKYK